MHAAAPVLDAARFTPPAPVPAERDPPLIQQFLRSIARPIEGWPKAVFEEPIYRPPLPGLPTFVMDPAAIRTILADRAVGFPHGALWRRMMRPVWGEGLVTADGADWRWQRQAASPAFRPAQMAALAGRMAVAAEAALGRWRAAGDGATFDMAEEAGQVTLDIILDAVLSGGEDFERGDLRQRIVDFMGQVGRMKLSYFLAPDSHHVGRLTPPSEAAVLLRDDVAKMARRRRSAPARGDLVDLLMAATDPETGRAMDDETLRDNLLGFIVAGHETSAVALSWSLYLATVHGPTLQRLREDVEAATGGAPIGPEHVERLVFARQVVSEAMRLYPPAHALTRVCAEPISIGDVQIKAGSRVLVPIYAIHRHRALWRDPDVFDPDRFAPGEPAPDRYAYLPFGAGPRICLGAAFAMTELVVILSTLVRGADFSLAPGQRVWPKAGLALRPEHGLSMQVRTRT